MAKSDFCFTFYDGDAARDMAHMNRLERGGYTDLIISQRKFGHLSVDQIKKILGKDFEEIWGAIEIVLSVDQTGKFFIQWLDSSEAKAKLHSKKQKENVENRYQQPTNNLPNEYQNNTNHIPLEDGNGNEDVGKDSFGKSENLLKNVPREETEKLEQELSEALNDLWLEPLKLKWQKRIDWDFEIDLFREKIRGSPGEYQHHEVSGLRKAFNYHLGKATSKPKKEIRKIDLTHL